MLKCNHASNYYYDKISKLAMKIIAFLIFAAGSANAIASSCWLSFVESEAAKESGKSALQIRAERAEYIFVAEATTTIKTTIQSKGEEPRISQIHTEFQVEDFIKGKGPEKISVEGRFGCGCHYDFTPSVSYLVFASKENETGKLVTVACKNILPALEDYVEFVKQELGKN